MNKLDKKNKSIKFIIRTIEQTILCSDSTHLIKAAPDRFGAGSVRAIYQL